MYIPALALPLLASLSEKLFGAGGQEGRPPTSFPGHQLYQLNDGNYLPSPFFGVGSVLKGTNVSSNVLLALDTGYRAFDSAAFYRTESTEGEALRSSSVPREAMYLTSKYDGLHGEDDVVAEVEATLKELGTPYLDLYLIHAPMFVTDIKKVWRRMEDLVDNGFTRSIGVSNYNATQLSEILSFARIKPAVNQIRYHAYNAKTNEPLLALCKKHGIVVEGYSALTPITTQPGGPADPVAAAVAARLSLLSGRPITPGQATLAWLRTKGIVAITTSSKEERLKEQMVPFEDEFPYAWTKGEMDAYEAHPGWNGTA